MANRIRLRKWIFLSVLTLIAASLITVSSLSAKRQEPNQQQRTLRVDPRPRVTTMPLVYSKIKDLEIVRTWIEDPNTPHASAAVEIRNNSHKDVLMVDLVSGEGGVTRNGLEDEEHPIVVITSGGTTTMRMNFGEMTFGAPLVVGGVIYADGTEEGDEASLKPMRILRSHDKAQRKAEKERQTLKGAPTP